MDIILQSHKIKCRDKATGAAHNLYVYQEGRQLTTTKLHCTHVKRGNFSPAISLRPIKFAGQLFPNLRTSMFFQNYSGYGIGPGGFMDI